MSRASQLFSTRRPRWNRGATPPPPPPHHHHHLHHRHSDEADADDPHGRLLRRRICHRHRLLRNFGEDHDHTCEHEFNAATNSDIAEFGTRNNSEAGEANGRIYDLRFDRNDRLPGTVLQARARLLERLRGTSSMGTRMRTTPHNMDGAFSTNGSFQRVDFGDWDLEFVLQWPELGSPSSQSTTPLEQPRSADDSSQKRPGLSCKIINSLKREIFGDSKDAVVHVSPECSICLETFLEGDGLIRLPCSHRFHSSCLIPWLRSRGDCPNCRTLIRLMKHVK